MIRLTRLAVCATCLTIATACREPQREVPALRMLSDSDVAAVDSLLPDVAGPRAMEVEPPVAIDAARTPTAMLADAETTAVRDTLASRPRPMTDEPKATVRRPP